MTYLLYLLFDYLQFTIYLYLQFRFIWVGKKERIPTFLSVGIPLSPSFTFSAAKLRVFSESAKFFDEKTHLAQ